MSPTNYDAVIIEGCRDVVSLFLCGRASVLYSPVGPAHIPSVRFHRIHGEAGPTGLLAQEDIEIKVSKSFGRADLP